MASDPLISPEYWTNIQITRQDVEFLHNYLFEHETPLTARELVSVFVETHSRRAACHTEQREAGGKTYLPKDSYQVGDDMSSFPRLDWKHGKVTSVRAGANPEIGPFDVLTVDLDGGENASSHRIFRLTH
jgi:hypothetical protein